ncbi:MAG: DUF3368 domain-containing protein [Bacteroidota bacterium]
MRLVVCDTSPLIFLSVAKQLRLLTLLFDEVWVPEAVLTEIEEGIKVGYPAVEFAQQLPDYQVMPDATPLPAWLARDLGVGELAVMSIARDVEDQRVRGEIVALLDDQLARRVAASAGLTVWGTLRVILEGKKAGHLSEVQPTLEKMRDAGMHLAPKLIARVLALAGE